MDRDALREIVRARDERTKDLYFASWGTTRAYAAHDDFNGFTAHCLENRFLPGNSMARRLEFGTEIQPQHIFKLEQIDQFWGALEHYVGKPLSRLHSNRTRNAPDYHWSEENLMDICDRYAEDFEVFEYSEHRP